MTLLVVNLHSCLVGHSDGVSSLQVQFVVGPDGRVNLAVDRVEESQSGGVLTLVEGCRARGAPPDRFGVAHVKVAVVPRMVIGTAVSPELGNEILDAKVKLLHLCLAKEFQGQREVSALVRAVQVSQGIHDMEVSSLTCLPLFQYQAHHCVPSFLQVLGGISGAELRPLNFLPVIEAKQIVLCKHVVGVDLSGPVG